MKNLKRSMQEVAENRDYTRRAPKPDQNEINYLIEILNTFLSRLEANYEIRESTEREIIELNAILENRIRQRTNELEQTVEHLQKTQKQMVWYYLI